MEHKKIKFLVPEMSCVTIATSLLGNTQSFASLFVPYISL